MFYRFRIGRTVVWLDAVSYVGRRPSSPRIIYGQMPRLVRVPSPRQEVSSTHVELRQLGASVVLTDMRSTNGSIVFPPGGEPRKLRQGESVVATPGTLVDIGDGNVIEILPLESRPPSDDPGSSSDEHSAGVVTEGRQ
jgi:pSer/pThr/pTyr-binding forkhead associated (FHA) protein